MSAVAWPYALHGAVRVVDGTRGKCAHPSCLIHSGSQYAGAYWCRRHATEAALSERYPAAGEAQAR